MKAIFKTRLVANGDRYETVADIDFANVTDNEVRELAKRTVVIDQQKIYRDVGKVPTTDNISVRDQLDGKRAPKDPMIAAMVAIQKLSPELRAMLLEQMAE